MAYASSTVIGDDGPYHLEPVIDEWYGKRFTAMGDSIVQNGAAMLDKVRDRLGFASYRNYGVSGRPMADGTRNGVGTVTTSAHLYFDDDVMVYVAAGTNDFKLNVPLGSIGSVNDTSFDRETFYGAYREVLRHIIASNPCADIYLATPLQRDHDGYTIESRNTAGHMLDDYRNAVIALGEMHAVPVIDMYALSGISKRTLSLYTKEGLHPNAAGYARMARVAVAQIRSTA